MQITTNQEAPKNGSALKEKEAAPKRELRTLVPNVDVFQNADEVLVLADIPGVKTEDLSLYFDKDALTLTAERKDANVVYKRVFQVPTELDADRIEAKLDGGVLTLKLPKRASAKPRQIPVNTR